MQKKMLVSQGWPAQLRQIHMHSSELTSQGHYSNMYNSSMNKICSTSIKVKFLYFRCNFIYPIIPNPSKVRFGMAIAAESIERTMRVLMMHVDGFLAEAIPNPPATVGNIPHHMPCPIPPYPMGNNPNNAIWNSHISLQCRI